MIHETLLKHTLFATALAIFLKAPSIVCFIEPPAISNQCFFLNTFGAGGNRGQLTRSAYGNMPVGTGMTHSSGVFTFPSTGVYEISAKWLIQRYSWNGTLKINMELSTDSGSSYVTGYDPGGIDTASAAALELGKATATSVALGASDINTISLGPLTVLELSLIHI